MLPDEATDASEALHLADERLYAQKYSRRGETGPTMDALLDALAEREPGLQVHSEGVAALAVDAGRMLGMRRNELEELSRAAGLHDLGKLAVPDEILGKPGPLDEREREFIRQHTLVGERILRASPAFRSVATVVRSSHERWEGTGYPDGLAGEDIPLASRIICASVRRDDLASSLPAAARSGGCTWGARAGLGDTVRPDRRARSLGARARSSRSRARRVGRNRLARATVPGPAP